MTSPQSPVKRPLFVESYIPVELRGKQGMVHIRPLPNQWCHASHDVSCSRRMTDTSTYPLGTVFKVMAHITNREGGGRYAYVNPRDPVIRASQEEVDSVYSSAKQSSESSAR